MRVIFLNTWNGKMEEGIKDFIASEAPRTDVFCLQEVYDSSKPLFESWLPGFNRVYAYKSLGNHDDFPQATFVKKNLEIVSSRVLLEDVPNVGLGLYTEIKRKNGNVHIANIHGVALPGEKLDNSGRLRQSHELIDFFRPLHGQKVIGGDLNILPDTESVRMFEQHGYVDLIKKYRISTTRNRLSWELYPDGKQYYSDYAFVSPEVNVQSFAVPNNEISDHLPLILDMG